MLRSREVLDRIRASARAAGITRRVDVFAWCTVALMATTAYMAPRFGVPAVQPGFNPSPMAVAGGDELLQWFQSSAGGLQTVWLRVLEVTREVAVDISVGFYGGGRLSPVATTTRVLSPLAEPHWLEIAFPPIDTTGAVEFGIAISVRDDDLAPAFTLQAAEGHAYPEGGLVINGVTVGRDLVMRSSAAYAQPWRAFQRAVRRRTGVRHLEWLIPALYLPGLYLILRSVKLG